MFVFVFDLKIFYFMRKEDETTKEGKIRQDKAMQRKKEKIEYHVILVGVVFPQMEDFLNKKEYKLFCSV